MISQYCLRLGGGVRKRSLASAAWQALPQQLPPRSQTPFKRDTLPRSASSFSSKSNGLMPSVFEYKSTPFNSATIDVSKAAPPDGDSAMWALKLHSTLNHLKAKGKAALWLKIPMDYSHYISICGHYGFKFHHTQPDFAMMVSWLPTNVPNKIPAFASHHVGVAGCVINDKEEVLVVKERNEARGGSMWKFPGGIADVGEDIGQAATREVLEETGIQANFQSIVTFRQSHKTAYGNSDLYFFCRMKAESSDIKTCAHEILEVGAEMQSPMLQAVGSLLTKNAADTDIIKTEHPSVDPTRPPNQLYHRPL